MVHRWVRIAVVVVALATLGYTGNQIRLSERALDDERSIQRVFTDLSWTLSLTLADLGAAQQAYVAAGQDRLYWTAKVNSHLDTVRGSLDNLRRLAISSTSIEALDAADGALADLERVDRRAQEHLDAEQSLLASDLVFTDGLELVARAATHVEFARATEHTVRNETIRTARSSQGTMVAAAAGVSMLALLLLVPMRRSEDEDQDGSDSADADGSIQTGTARLSPEDRLMLDNLDLAASPAAETSRDANTASEATPAEPTPDLRVAADLCTDLCRLSDTSELPAILARAAALMNANGLIVWVRDSTGQGLRPAIGHGYPPGTLARLGSIAEDSNNATAAAYRTARMQVVRREDDDASGALAAPLMAADSCVGVLSAELRDGWESSDAVQATAAIMTAQLATLLSPDPPAEKVSAQATR